MLKGFNKYYRTDEKLQLIELKWMRLKIGSISVFLVVVSLASILVVNKLSQDPLGLGYDKVNMLSHENGILREQLISMKSHMDDLQKVVDKLNVRGDELRLMADLPRMEKEVISAGTGGTVYQPDVSISSDGHSEILQSAMTSLQHLRSEIIVQQQSYDEIFNKYKYNKGYFASLPALKPMDGYYSVNGFGLRMHPVLGVSKTHEGIDIINDVGTPVYASGDGVITMSGQSGGGYGIAVAINHGYGYQSLYAHLSKVLVKDGQHVRRGDLIAKSGKTGLVSGPHLHYEIRRNGICQNPVDFFLNDMGAKEYQALASSR